MAAYATSSLVADARREETLQVVPKPIDLEKLIGLTAETTCSHPR